MVRDRHGYADDVDIVGVECPWNTSVVELDLLVVSATEQYEILSVEPQRSFSSTPDYMALVVKQLQ